LTLGERRRGASAGDAGQPFVFDADIEAAEAYFMRRARGYVVAGAILGTAVLAEGLVTCGSLRLLVAALAAFVAGSVVAASAGWWLAGWMVELIRARSGVLAADATRAGLWRKTDRERAFARWRYEFRRPAPEDVPPGMTLDEYTAARGRARRLAWVGIALCLPALAWLLALIMGARQLAGSWSEGVVWLAVAAWVLPLHLVGPAAWLVRWRRHRDEVARWTGALTMDDFMRTRGWEWQWFHGWRRAAQ
jgi:hypothetical protein